MARPRVVQPEAVPLDHGPGLDIVQATRDCILDLVGPHAHPTAQAGVDSVDVVLGAHLSAARGGARVALPLSGADLDLDVSIT